MALCRHCKKHNVSRPRGLCWACFYRPDVRQRYPPKIAFVRHSHGTAVGPRRLPLFPTQALPGTPEKIAVLTQRAGLGLELWHPEDALLDRRLLPLHAG
jgi:hypothetical protein